MSLSYELHAERQADHIHSAQHSIEATEIHVPYTDPCTHPVTILSGWKKAAKLLLCEFMRSIEQISRYYVVKFVPFELLRTQSALWLHTATYQPNKSTQQEQLYYYNTFHLATLFIQLVH